MGSKYIKEQSTSTNKIVSNSCGLYEDDCDKLIYFIPKSVWPFEHSVFKVVETVLTNLLMYIRLSYRECFKQWLRTDGSVQLFSLHYIGKKHLNMYQDAL